MIGRKWDESAKGGGGNNDPLQEGASPPIRDHRRCVDGRIRDTTKSGEKQLTVCHTSINKVMLPSRHENQGYHSGHHYECS